MGVKSLVSFNGAKVGFDITLVFLKARILVVPCYLGRRERIRTETMTLRNIKMLAVNAQDAVLGRLRDNIHIPTCTYNG